MFHRLLQSYRLPRFLPHPEEIRSQYPPQHLLPHSLRDGHGRQGRPPHHGHHPRGHPLHKIQDYAEWEEVMNKGHLRKIHASRIGKRENRK